MNVCYKREIRELYLSMPEINKEYKSQRKIYLIRVSTCNMLCFKKIHRRHRIVRYLYQLTVCRYTNRRSFNVDKIQKVKMK